jgi:hypothetical protein
VRRHRSWLRRTGDACAGLLTSLGSHR